MTQRIDSTNQRRGGRPRLLDVRLILDRDDFVIVKVDGERANTRGLDRMATALRILAVVWLEENERLAKLGET